MNAPPPPSLADLAATVLGDTHEDAGSPLGDLAEALRRLQRDHWTWTTHHWCKRCNTPDGVTRSGRCGAHQGSHQVRICASCRYSACICNVARP